MESTVTLCEGSHPKTKEFPKVTSENLFERGTARRNYFYLEHWISHGRLKALTDNSSKIPGSSKALISL